VESNPVRGVKGRVVSVERHEMATMVECLDCDDLKLEVPEKSIV
jgi:hypothetical protein